MKKRSERWKKKFLGRAERAANRWLHTVRPDMKESERQTLMLDENRDFEDRSMYYRNLGKGKNSYLSPGHE